MWSITRNKTNKFLFLKLLLRVGLDVCVLPGCNSNKLPYYLLKYTLIEMLCCCMTKLDCILKGRDVCRPKWKRRIKRTLRTHSQFKICWYLKRNFEIILLICLVPYDECENWWMHSQSLGINMFHVDEVPLQ